MKFELKGLDSLNEKLNKLKDIDLYAVNTDKLKEDARSLVPVDTGNLRDSIYCNNDGKNITLGATAPYASYVEYGTSKQSPQPYLQPTLDMNKNYIVDCLRNELKKIK